MLPRILLLIGLLPTFALADEEMSTLEVKDVLQMAIDAQLTRESKWTVGKMHVAIRQTGANALSAELTLCWEDDRRYVDVKKLVQESISVKGELHEEETPPHRKSMTKSKYWTYVPSLAVVHGSGPGRHRDIPDRINVVPLNTWSTVPYIRQRSLVDWMRRARDYEALSGIRAENGEVRITAWSTVYVIDPAHDAHIVRIENDLIERSEEAKQVSDPFRYIATYDWATDSHGVPYCRTLRTEFFGSEEGSDVPVSIREISVSEYTSRPTSESKRFDLDALEVPKGTLVKYRDAKSARSWRYGVQGSEAQGLRQPDFDRLIDQLKQDGFASPSEKD